MSLLQCHVSILSSFYRKLCSLCVFFFSPSARHTCHDSLHSSPYFTQIFTLEIFKSRIFSARARKATHSRRGWGFERKLDIRVFPKKSVWHVNISIGAQPFLPKLSRYSNIQLGLFSTRFRQTPLRSTASVDLCSRPSSVVPLSFTSTTLCPCRWMTAIIKLTCERPASAGTADVMLCLRLLGFLPPSNRTWSRLTSPTRGVYGKTKVPLQPR